MPKAYFNLRMLTVLLSTRCYLAYFAWRTSPTRSHLGTMEICRMGDRKPCFLSATRPLRLPCRVSTLFSSRKLHPYPIDVDHQQDHGRSKLTDGLSPLLISRCSILQRSAGLWGSDAYHRPRLFRPIALLRPYKQQCRTAYADTIFR